MLFMDLLIDWKADTNFCKEDYDLWTERFIDDAEPDDFTNEIDTFGKLQETPNEDFHKEYFCLYTEVENKYFCPSYPDKCNGCERSDRKDMDFIEVIYRKSDGKRVEANWYYANDWTNNHKYYSLSTCCLAAITDLPSGFYCSDCGEDND